MDGDSQTTLVSTKAAPSASALFTDSVTAATTNPKAQTQAIHKPEIDIFAASQRGDVDAIRTLIDSGSASATDRDPQNITPLHWAAINAQLPTCQYLLEQGAEVDARGGDLVATPLQWAARNGHFYIIQLLIAHGADPKITDTQGFNTLHIVTHSSRVMSLLCILHQPICVDSRDPEGHTSLMWAVYQGNASSVDVLLEHGANVNIKDDVGLTALHWAVVRGDRNCIRRLLEHGAEINAKDNEGRTARDMAVEFKILGTWERALEEGDLTEDGLKRKKPLSDARLGGRRHRCWTCLSGCRHRLWTSLVESRSGKHRGGFHAIESAWNQTNRFCSTYLGANIGIQLKSVFVAQTLTPNHRQKSRD